MPDNAPLDDVNPALSEAVVFGTPEAGLLAPGPPLLVIAAAGPGKTSTLAHLVLKGADPGWLLARRA